MTSSRAMNLFAVVAMMAIAVAQGGCSSATLSTSSFHYPNLTLIETQLVDRTCKQIVHARQRAVVKLPPLSLTSGVPHSVLVIITPLPLAH